MDCAIEDRVIRVITNNQKIITGVVTSDKTLEELGMDSLDAINLLYALEEEFNIVLPNEARNYTTVRSIIEGMRLIVYTQAQKPDFCDTPASAPGLRSGADEGYQINWSLDKK